MASAFSTEEARQAQAAKVELDNGDGTRDIHRWKDETQTDTVVKFLSVPYTYDLDSIKHADHVAAITIYNDGQHWLTIKGKRLFRFPDDTGGNISPEYIQPFPSTAQPLMSPEELKERLASNYPPYAILKHQYDESQELRRRMGLPTMLELASRSLDARDRSTCSLEMCEEESDCTRHHGTLGECRRCTIRSGRNFGDCNWYAGIVNSFPAPKVPVGVDDAVVASGTTTNTSITEE
jgi:hypothetical protein